MACSYCFYSRTGHPTCSSQPCPFGQGVFTKTPLGFGLTTDPPFDKRFSTDSFGQGILTRRKLVPKAAVMHDTLACVNHGYPSAPNPKPLKNNIHFNTTPPLRSQDQKKTIEGFNNWGVQSHNYYTLQNTPSYIPWKKKHYILHPFKTPHYTLHPTICVILLGLVVSWNPSQPQPTTFCQQFFTPTKKSWCLELALQQQLSFCQGFLQIPLLARG